MREILLPMTEDTQDEMLVTGSGRQNVVSILSGTQEDEEGGVVHCGFAGLVRIRNHSLPYWQECVRQRYFFMTHSETEELLSQFGPAVQIPFIRGTYAMRHEELDALRIQHCSAHGHPGTIIERMAALHNAYSRKIDSIHPKI
ncbi:hypothetical protein FJZ28_00920 [Candidatus Peregrinibacteria bacterium]|nr:hypothetical protein [Candidatus Peregrinibacteria bacterium]